LINTGLSRAHRFHAKIQQEKVKDSYPQAAKITTAITAETFVSQWQHLNLFLSTLKLLQKYNLLQTLMFCAIN